MLNKKEVLMVFLCVQCVYTAFVRYTPIVKVAEGRLRGIRDLNRQNQYFGIPYSISERFQPPKPPRKWSGLFEAVQRFSSCPQNVAIFNFGTEDCLKLDVYTPEHASIGQKLPVLVFFHGGAYYYGAKWHYNPEFLVKKNVIVVIANYRLGVLGFLCLNNVANLGLKDQLAALRWIQKNIAAFGGDPDNVTLSGHSAGASSSSMHILSKRSKGLFHKAILLSGAALTPWAFNLDPLRPAYEDAGKLRKVQNEREVYDTFLKASLHDLLAVSRGISIDPKYFKYSPCYDGNLTDVFFHDTPYNIIKSGDFNKVPTIIGYTNLEGVLFYGLNNQKNLYYLDNTLPDRLPSTFSWCSEKDKRRIADKIRSHYFGTQRINSGACTKELINLYSDWIAYASIDAYSRLMAKYSDKPIYNYMFSYEGNRNFASFLLNSFGIPGTTHSDDIFYLFKPGGITFNDNNLDKLMIEMFTTMITNFMKFGDPTPTESKLIPMRWPPITANWTQVMNIDHPMSVIDTPDRYRGGFFLELLCEFGLKGYVPCESAMHCNLDE
ncbi:unnamed protein product [Arctia plantaginis]|uniref:Carboxylic ester hydrolase n=1 Tax=Arctia plantaginis TaxID=874455 RepID=A0A8S1BDP5_ARCPL|nr:unnamed protein product [Arctia plantaginis]